VEVVKTSEGEILRLLVGTVADEWDLLDDTTGLEDFPDAGEDDDTELDDVPRLDDGVDDTELDDVPRLDDEVDDTELDDVP